MRAEPGAQGVVAGSEMIERSLPIRNFYWADDLHHPPLEAVRPGELGAALSNVRGQFSLVWRARDGTVILARDPLGINKLFFAVREPGEIVAANYLIDLVNHGIPFEAVYSVPAGHFVQIDLDDRQLAVRPYFTVNPRHGKGDVPATPGQIRQHLETWFCRLAEQFPRRPVCVTLSGGLDSSLIAALAAKYFADVTAYTYWFAESDRRMSDDVASAQRVAEFLGLPLRLVRADAHDVLGVLEDALCYGQDWRDFNAHCAIVNEILARVIASDARRAKPAAAPGPGPETAAASPLVLTGDVGNELVADYTPLCHEGRTVYSVPRIPPRDLRTALLRGLDAGDREVGVFNHHGLDVIQPYGLAVDDYLRLPASTIGATDSKQVLMREMAEDLLPAFVFERQKARAQIGDAIGPGGILTTLMRTGCDARALRQAFARRFGVAEEQSLNGFIRMGRYRFPSTFPDWRDSSHGADVRDHRPHARAVRS